MDSLYALADGFKVALTPAHLAWSLAGVCLGTAVGVLPGLGPALTVSLLLPVTFGVDPTAAFIMFAGIYYGAMYGGSTTSILLNTPGESATIVTAIEGHAMARAGRARAALATAAIGSFVAGTIATLALAFAAPLLVTLALRMGPAEYFALIVLAFAAVVSLLGKSLARGMFSLFLGLALGLVGLDPRDGQARLTFGVAYLLDGVDPIIVAIGLFAVGESLFMAVRAGSADQIIPVRGAGWMTRGDWMRSWPAWLRGTAIGFPLGALPAGGAELPTLLSYGIERRLSRKPEEFGRGAIEGVAGPEAANNASAAGTLVPLLTLGLPTSATAAMLLAAFQQYGLRPGPLLFEGEPDLVWGVIASLFVGNTMLLFLNLPLVGVWAKLLATPRPYLYGGILVLATVGAYSVHGSPADLVLLYVIGVGGMLLRIGGFPIAPVIIGLLLGPMAEQQLARAVAIAGSGTAVLQRPASAAMLVAAAGLLAWPILSRARRRRADVRSASGR